ncbi:MAG TPA: hypothetical protein VJZ00_12250 [Thermoanaerobaculia bacterium]|nr:hypothetical protein [Thermoanaerobaculia bacterium]
MKRLRLLALLTLVLASAPALLAADFGVRVGRSNETHENFVGVELVYDLGALTLNPNVEYSLEDDVTAGSVNLDVTVDVLQVSALRPYLGAGVGLSYLDANGASQSNVVGNLIGGINLATGSIEPYGQVKYSRLFENGSDSEVSFAVGLRF